MRIKQYILALGLAALTSVSASAAPIFYTVENIDDENGGDDLWRYNYFVANETGIEIDTIVILFDSVDYDFNLVDTGFGLEVRDTDYGTPTGWQGTVAPDEESGPLGPADGFFAFSQDLLDPFDPFSSATPFGAQSALAPIAGFFVDFIWRGNGTPGEQFFEFYSSSDPFGFPAGSDFTSLLPNDDPVDTSEPFTLALLGLGLLALAAQRKTPARRGAV